jgi:hypothetical protein
LVPNNVGLAKIGGGVAFESAGATSGPASFNGSKEALGSSTTFESTAPGSKAGMLDLADIHFSTLNTPQHVATGGAATKIALLDDPASTFVASNDSSGSKPTINSPAAGEVNAILAAEGDGFMYRGTDSFVFGAGFGHDTIAQFGDSATDQGLLDSSAAIFADFAAVKAATELAGTDVHVDVGASGSSAFIDTVMANLGMDDFRFH